MSVQPIIECVPNFSDGRNMHIIQQITNEIELIKGVKLLDVDPGKDTNRTVVTFVGHPEAVVEAAFQAIKKAAELIDMQHHKGEHPRMGATDVCPLIPIAGISMEETVAYAKKLAQRVGLELGIPIYLYEEAASVPERRNLAHIRSGEYEGLAKKIVKPEWCPDFGPQQFVPKSGATVIGARDFLIAYNVNLNTKSVRRANSVAFDIREQGRVKVDPDTGKKMLDDQGEFLRIPGTCKSVKAIGWYIEEYGVAQVSMNLTNIRDTPLHIAFEEAAKSASTRGMRVTGSELVGLVPKHVILEAGRYFLRAQNRSEGVSEAELIDMAVISMGLNELAPFNPQKKIIEYVMSEPGQTPLLDSSLRQFFDQTASESPAPGGGSVSAMVGAVGVALGTMVANLSAQKPGWEKNVSYFSTWASQGQHIKDQLALLIDEDTHAFNQIMEAIRLPKNTEQEKSFRNQKLHDATQNAIEVPLKVMKICFGGFELMRQMEERGNPNSLSDVGVGVACLHTAITGAYMNVLINCKDFSDTAYVTMVKSEAESLFQRATEENDLLRAKIFKRLV